MRKRVGTKYAIGVTSGTGALHTALSALGVGPGQEVIVPAYMWISVLAAVVNLDAIPVLADIDETFCLNPAAVEKCITPKTRGIIMVHMSGAPGNAKAIQKIARDHKIFLLEDCAQCNGGSIKGQKVGTFGDMGIFSFQMNKNMTAGEGGAVVTNNHQLYQRAFACHDLGYARDENGRLIFDNPDSACGDGDIGLTSCALPWRGCSSRNLPRIIKAMQHSKYRIRKALEKFPRVQLRKIQDPAGDTGCFLITTYPDAETAKKVNLALRAEGIVTHAQGVSNVVMTDWGLHLYYNNVGFVEHASVDGDGTPWKLAENAGLERSYAKGACPTADSLFERSVLIAIPSCLKKQDEDDIIRAFTKVLSVYLP